MPLPELKELIKRDFLIFDGAMGTMLQSMGFPEGGCPEEWNVTQADKVKKVHKGYLLAGAQVLTTNTFGGNPIKLSLFGLEREVKRFNIAGVKLAKEIAGDKAYIAGSMGPTGKLIEPMGELSFEEAYNAFKEQAIALEQGGADLIIIETMSDIMELKAAIMAIKENTSIPFIAMMTFEQGGLSLTGSSPAVMAVTVEAFKPLALGSNCGMGPAEMVTIIDDFYLNSNIPLIAEPNAGLPKFINGKTVFDLSPEDFASYMYEIAKKGARILGGCCGTTPDHIKALKGIIKNLTPKPVINIPGVRFSSRTKIHTTYFNLPFTIIGERINPTGRKKLSAQFKKGEFMLAKSEAKKQFEAGAHLLDVNVGVPQVDEVNLMKNLVNILQNIVPLPLSIDSNDPSVIESALKIYAGKPLVNSVSGEIEKMEKILPLVKKFGTSLIVLTMDEKGLPQNFKQRLEVLEKILHYLEKYDISTNNILVDCLTLTAGSQQEQVLQTLKALNIVAHNFKLNTVLGVSNVSFGLPQRPILTSTFLSMAMAYGLTSAIVNPLQFEIQKAIKASEVLLNIDKGAKKYINFVKNLNIQNQLYTSKAKSEKIPPKDIPKISKPKSIQEILKNDILEGNQEEIIAHLKLALQSQLKPYNIIQNILLPAMVQVGKLYEQKIYFLPHLIIAGDTMKKAVDFLTPFLPKSEKEKKLANVIMATVKGDLHDIGKNIVSLMLKNNGFNVIDLGKDVPLELILDTINEKQIHIVGLSSLMTTTMKNLSIFVPKIKKYFPNVITLVGGAVVTEKFAKSIGADGYADDAIGAVNIAKYLIGM